MILKLAIILCAIFVVAKTDDPFASIIEDVKDSTKSMISHSLDDLFEAYKNYSKEIKKNANEFLQIVNNSSQKLLTKLRLERQASQIQIQKIDDLAEAQGVDISKCNDWKNEIEELKLAVQHNIPKCDAKVSKVRQYATGLVSTTNEYSYEIAKIRDLKVPTCLVGDNTEAAILERIKCLHRFQVDVIIEKTMAIMHIIRVDTELKQNKILADVMFADFCQYPETHHANLEALRVEHNRCFNEKRRESPKTK